MNQFPFDIIIILKLDEVLWTCPIVKLSKTNKCCAKTLLTGSAYYPPNLIIKHNLYNKHLCFLAKICVFLLKRATSRRIHHRSSIRRGRASPNYRSHL
ncbi:hypothetical protein EJ08DRAFT_6726 [Tothia fuscella]|uniref:Uncharacterized protein n=1 Tax=Tothia fuscella TaxID=1048955 RepID=A0A9P4U3J0_9PEZI|nr:hypothetical protein EJ08DRAFT_6726 [Tothia fuscella]